ncbi:MULTISPECIES: hypothetical protein [Sphingomonas]|uniref:Uncharacterized protein n=1 Tax=Sphingomonas adhaesiva TaxID=28212 RepID=A0A2A4IE30_9SPHN|nr:MULTISPECIES: hypothetical protein [Sphingomonas]PCG16082.1 hypothetical protein COA07_03865 [Sphingomonas adhaesiva]PZU79742.1 MAG: hypothetical protein DI530_07875 [Sphingomonas sp.]
MAYLSFDPINATPVAAPRTAPAPLATPLAATADVAPRLSALEWSVVALARNDRLSSLRAPGRMTTAMRVIFRQYNRMLADDRLEALRRIAVLGWHHGYAVPSHEVARFLRAGYSQGQYELMMDSIGAAHATRQPRR